MNAIMCSPLQAALLCGGMVLAIEALWYIVVDGVLELRRELQAEHRNSQTIGKGV